MTTAQFVAAIAHFGVELSIKEAEAFFGRYTASYTGRAEAGLCVKHSHPTPADAGAFLYPIVLTSTPRRLDL